jgi:hypothetical protein
LLLSGRGKLLLLPFKAMLLSERARASKGPKLHSKLERLAALEDSPRPGDRPSGQFDYGRIVHWKADRPKRILGACPNRVIDPVDAARFMTAASTS